MEDFGVGEAALGAAMELAAASANSIESAFQDAFHELGDIGAPASWVDTPEEDVEYLLKEYRPEVRELRDKLIILQGMLNRAGLATSNLDEYIDGLNGTLSTLEKLEQNPQSFYAVLEKIGGSVYMYNAQLERESEIAEILNGLRYDYQNLRVATL